jgi:ABC-2 type transport system permease protein
MLETEGYVDASGLIQIMPENLPEGALVAYPDEASGRRALDQGEIAALHLIPADYVATGALVTIRPDLNRVAARSSAGWMDIALLLNLVGGNRELAGQVWQPMDLQHVNAAQTEQGAEMDDDNVFALLLTRYLPGVIMLLLYGMIALGGGMLMGSVSDEKKNRVMEIMLLAVNARQMVSGKVVALGLAGLLQAVGWVCVSYLLFQLAGVGGSLPEGLKLPGSLLLWSVVFFLLGYGIYACLMAGAGALLPNVKESPMVSLFFYAPAFVGFEISLFSTGNPHGLLPTIASLFPLTAPFSMINRLAVGGVPLWQVLLSVGLMVITIPLIVQAVARMFRTQVLLSSQPFTIKRYLRVLVGRGA